MKDCCINEDLLEENIPITKEYDPVIGCDDKIYSNKSEALSKGITYCQRKRDGKWLINKRSKRFKCITNKLIESQDNEWVEVDNLNLKNCKSKNSISVIALLIVIGIGFKVIRK